jgi:cytochrome bd ubiquinol oxidase subunit II
MLETVWFLLWGVLWAIYFALDGFDLGLAVLMPALAKNDRDRRIVYNAMGPFWDGNEVWLITAGGVTFAAFPAAYATLFSAFYTPLMVILFGLILRAIAFEFRSKLAAPRWRSLWDGVVVVGSFLPALLFGVAFANIFRGIPIDGDGVFHGTLLTLLNPYGLAGGLFFLAFFLYHGSLWLAIKAEGALQEQAVTVAGKLWNILLLFTLLFLALTKLYTTLYDNFLAAPFLLAAPLLAVAALIATRVYLHHRAYWKAWAASGLFIFFTTMFAIIGLYPNMIPSSIRRTFNITLFNAASSTLTLTIMLVVTLIFVPIVILYQGWAYRLFSGKVTREEVESEEAY